MRNSEAVNIHQDHSLHLIGDDPEILRRIQEKGVNLCLWQRDVQPEIVRELSFLTVSSLPELRCTTTAASLDADVCHLLSQQGINPDGLDNWRKDMQQLANVYFSLSNDRQVTLRIEFSDGTRCPRFHVDRTHLRLLCTYKGPGTEWLSNEQVDRHAQANGAANESIVRYGEPKRFNTYSVGIMKGEIYPGNSGNGLVHRSPANTGENQSRILFCLDS